MGEISPESAPCIPRVRNALLEEVGFQCMIKDELVFARWAVVVVRKTFQDRVQVRSERGKHEASDMEQKPYP